MRSVGFVSALATGAMLVAGGCAETQSAAPAEAPVAPGPTAATAPTPAPPRRNLFLSQTTCTPDALCPVDPPFPKVKSVHFDGGRPCIEGLDRSGCLEDDGWHFTTVDAAVGAMPASNPVAARFGPAPAECRIPQPGWLIPAGDAGTLFWSKRGERRLVGQGGCRVLPTVPLEPLTENDASSGIVARDASDVWAWTSKFVAHYDGARWERVVRPAPCERDAVIDASVVASDGSIWFVRCEDRGRVLVRFDPRSNSGSATALSPVLGLAVVAGKVTATDFDENTKGFRQNIFEPDGRPLSATPTDRPFLRAGFDDGTAFIAQRGLFSEVVRTGPGGAATIAVPTPAHGFYAPSSREAWLGGEKLYHWRDGMMSEQSYRPDSKKSVVETIDGSGSNDIWVASRTAAGGGASVQQLSHWNGTTWRQEPLGPSATRANALAVASPNDAWLTTEDALFHWNGASWSVAAHFPQGRGASLALTQGAVFLVGNDTIYRKPR